MKPFIELQFFWYNFCNYTTNRPIIDSKQCIGAPADNYHFNPGIFWSSFVTISFNMRILSVITLFFPSLLSVLLLFSCGSSEEKFHSARTSLQTVVRGNLKDAHSGSPLSGVRLSVFSASGSLEEWLRKDIGVRIYSETSTDERGNFEFRFESDGYDVYYLGCSELPAGYLPWADSHGIRYDVGLNTSNFCERTGERLRIEHMRYYDLTLLPAETDVDPDKKDVMITEYKSGSSGF